MSHMFIKRNCRWLIVASSYRSISTRTDLLISACRFVLDFTAIHISSHSRLLVLRRLPLSTTGLFTAFCSQHFIFVPPQWCLRMLIGIKWYQFVRNDDVRRLTKQPKLTATIQSCRLTLFGHIMRMDDNADAKRILLASPPADWRRQPGRPRITWLSAIRQDLKQHHLTLPEAADLAQNRPLWRLMSTYGATQS